MYDYHKNNNFQYKCVYQCDQSNQWNYCSQYHFKVCKYDQNYSPSCFSSDRNIYTPWQSVPYAGQDSLPLPETPDAGCWWLCFLKRDGNNNFLTPFGKPLDLNIKDPHTFMNLASEFLHISNLQCNLTYEQIQIAKYWGDGPATKQFMPIVDILIDTYSVPVSHASRILYIINGAINDTFRVTWYLKYLWNIIRPCQYNECFKTVLCTPMHPSYPSGHATSAGCMAEILSFFFPGEREKLFMLAKQCANSRLYAGVHFKLDCDEGINLGISIAKAILQYTSQQTDCHDEMIDKQYTTYKDANIIPITLEQYIPFNRLVGCPSLLLDTGCHT